MKRDCHFSSLGASVLCVLLLLSGTVASADDGKLQFNRDIRPILAENCLSCHGSDSASRKADLRLDNRDAAVERGAILPGEPSKGGLVERIDATDPDVIMPPPSTKKSLTVEQKSILKRWIQQGAEYQPHWSFIPPTRPTPPLVKNAAWVKNPIDAFVLARLEPLNLSPAPEADRRTLARRLSLDLTGLPASPEAVDRLVSDQSPDYYEKYVDSLLETPQWGEHRGRYWLDAARYGDTHGIHLDNFRETWAYRDCVIEAFNRNDAFDQFTIEQLAGDLLPNHTQSQLIASGFNRCNITTSEGGAIDEEYMVLYNRDRTETMSQVWMGLTAGCAVCHSHKFDPISQKEFYEMAAFFNNTTQPAMDGNVKDTPPVIVVPRDEDQPRYAELPGCIANAKAAVETRRQDARPDFDRWEKAATSDVLDPVIPVNGLELHAALNEGQGCATKVLVEGESKEIPLSASTAWIDGLSAKAIQVQGSAFEVSNVADFERDQAFSLSAWVKLLPNDSSGALVSRMRVGDGFRGWDLWIQGRRIGVSLMHHWPDDFLKSVSQTQVTANEWTHVAITYDGSGKAAGLKIFHNGKSQSVNIEADKLQGSIKTTAPFRVGERTGGDPAPGCGIQDVRVYRRALSPAEVEALAKATRLTGILAKSPESRSNAERNEIYPWWLGTHDREFQARGEKVSALEAEQKAIQGRGTIAHVMNEKNEEPMAFVLFRGEYDKRRDQVRPNTPAALLAFSETRPKNRYGLAQWLLDPAHPLTARVTVNRFWQELFGTGIVRTSGDFGVMGELPTNQELLDWLAIEFREGSPHLIWPQDSASSARPWDIKRFFRLLVTSNTYRQSAVANKDKLEKDPHNRLLSRGPRFRMDAEMIRDQALAVSGMLVKKIGGPSVKPYQPEGVWEAVAMTNSNTHDYQQDHGESLYRRSMYTFWKRSAPPASMEIFNATSRETCTVKRERTNTPLQALVTLNDVQFVEAARNLAQRVLQDQNPEHATETQRLHQLAKYLLARPFRPAELAIAQQSLHELQAYYEASASDAQQLISVGESRADSAIPAPTLAAWTMLVNELLNLDDVLNK